MNMAFLRWSTIAFLVGLFAILSFGCVVRGGGYGYDEGAYVDSSPGYYDEYGADYGGWGSRYEVGPIRGGENHRGAPGGRGSSHAFRSAPASRSMPSIPSRSGGGRSGGGQGGSRGR